jgi:hypothetical protein
MPAAVWLRLKLVSYWHRAAGSIFLTPATVPQMPSPLLTRLHYLLPHSPPSELNIFLIPRTEHPSSVTETGYCIMSIQEPGSSVSIVSGYGLDDRAIEVRSPAEAKGFSSTHFVQTSSGVHPASCKMGIGGPFPGGKPRPERDADHSPSSSVQVNSK